MKPLKALISLLFLLSPTALVHASLNGPPPGNTGAPGEGTCGNAGCHDIPSSNIGEIDVINTSPQHLDTVHISVGLYDITLGPSVHDWGFQITVVDSLSQPFGAIVMADSVRTQLSSDTTGRTYLSHTAAGVPGGSGNYTTWHFYWVRPPGASITDSVYYYVSGLLADDDGTRANDAVVTSLVVGPFCLVKLTGDANLTGDITSADIIHLIGYVFKGGSEPKPCVPAGDVNCDGQISSADIIYTVNYVFKGGLPPCDVCPLILDGTWACH